MNESRSNFTVLDLYSVWTHSQSFQKQYCSFTQYQVTPPVRSTQAMTELSKNTLFKV